MEVKDSRSEARCAGCGAVLPEEARFCVACGHPVGGEVASESGPCPACGAKVAPGSQFCTNCGAPLSGRATGQPASQAYPAAGSGDPHGAAYMSLLDTRLTQAGFQSISSVAGFESDRLYRRQRIEISLLNKVTTFCAIRRIPEQATVESLRAYSQSLYQYAQAQRSGLSRLTVQALFIYPVMVTRACPAEPRAFLETYWPKHYMAFEFPVVVIPEAKELCCRRSTPLWGLAFHKGLLREAESLFTP